MMNRWTIAALTVWISASTEFSKMAAIKVKSHSDKVKNKGMAPPSGPKKGNYTRNGTY